MFSNQRQPGNVETILSDDYITLPLSIDS